MSKTLIIFDIDGTLLYSNKVDSQCFADTYEQIYQQSFPTIDWHQYPHVTDETIFATVIKDQFGRTVDPAEVKTFQDEFTSKLRYKRLRNPELFEEIPGARAIVDYLHQEASVVLGIGTGGWRRPAELKLEHLGFATGDIHMSFADGHYTREDILDASIKSARSQHFDIERIVYVGDALWDVKTCRNMALPFIGIRRNGDTEVLRDAGASHIMTDYLDYKGFMDNVRQAECPFVV